MLSRVLTGLVIPVLVCTALLYLRSPSLPAVYPYDAAWCAWAFAVLTTGIGWGIGLSALWRAWQRDRARRR